MRERRAEMEREVAAGGFHSYRKLPTHNTISASAVNMGAGLHQISNNVDDNNNNNNQSSGCASDENECTVREQDRFMPIANVIRIMRRILPPHAKISDDAKETIQECVSEYISFITGEANDRCQREQRKTITAEDVLWAMSKLGFDDYIEPLSIYLHRYRELEGERASIRGDPFLKRTSSPVDFSAFGIAAFAPATAFHHHHHGFFGTPTVTGYLKDASDDNTTNPASSSYNAMANGDAFAHHK